MDFENLTSHCNESEQRQIVAFGGTFVAAGVLLVALRFYCKAKYVGKISIDDWLAFASVVGGAIGMGILVKWADTGLGRHVFCMPFSQAQRTLKWSLAGQMETVIGVALIKLSVCFRVLQVLDRVNRHLRMFLWMLIVLITLLHLSETIVLGIWCRPLNAVWNPNVTGKCLSYHQLYLVTYIHTGLDAFTDFICAWVPVFIILRLKMDMRTKIALCSLMALGCSVAACAIAKLVHLKDLWNLDFTWTTIRPVRWAIAEQFLCIVISSIPSLRPLFLRASTALSTTKKTKPSMVQRSDTSRGRRLPTDIPITLSFEEMESLATQRRGTARGCRSQSEVSSLTLIRSRSSPNDLDSERKEAMTIEDSPDLSEEGDFEKPLPPVPTKSEVQITIYEQVDARAAPISRDENRTWV